MSKSKKNQATEWGFSTLLNPRATRLISTIGNSTIQRKGLTWKYQSLYQYAITISWIKFFILCVLGFVLVNILFAIAYVLVGIEGLQGLRHETLTHDLLYSFFFSVQTLTSVGYGGIYPHSFGANVVASINAFIGLLGFAIITGLFFSRFSKPTAKILFSDYAIIKPTENEFALEFRIANARTSNLHEVNARVVLNYVDPTHPSKRIFTPLTLTLSSIMLLPLNWTIVHKIQEDSPFYKKTKEDLEAMQLEMLIVITGYDETYSQQVYALHSYISKEFRFNAKFEPMFYTDNKGHTILDFDKLSAIAPA